MSYHIPSYHAMTNRFLKSVEINPFQQSVMVEYMLSPDTSIAGCVGPKSIAVEGRRYFSPNVYTAVRYSTRGNGSLNLGFTIPHLPFTVAPRMGVAVLSNGIVKSYGVMGCSFELGEM